MNENDNKVQAPKDSGQARSVETFANQVLTNIIKDASETAQKNPNEINQFNVPAQSTQRPSKSEITNTNQPRTSTDNGSGDKADVDNDEIQKKMKDVIHKFQTHPNTDPNAPPKSVTTNNVNGTTVDPSTKVNLNGNSPQPKNDPVGVQSNQPATSLPIQHDDSLSESEDIVDTQVPPTNQQMASNDMSDQDDPEPIIQRLDYDDEDDEEPLDNKVQAVNNDQRSTSVMKQHVLDETTQFSTTTPPRASSVSSKQQPGSATPDQTSVSGDEKRSNLSPSKLPDDPGNDTDMDNREVANIARRPSRAESPLNRPRSPTPNDSRKMSTSNQVSVDQSQSSTKSTPGDQIRQSPSPSIEGQGKGVFEPARRESASKNNQEQTSRPTSAVKTDSDEKRAESPSRRPSTSRTNHFFVTDDVSKLIKPGEQLEIPTSSTDREHTNTPPPLPMDAKSIALTNPLVGDTIANHEQNRSRPPSATSRRSPTVSMVSNEKVVNGDSVLPKSGRESSLSQAPITDTDKKPASRRESQMAEQTPQVSGSRRASAVQPQQQQQDEVRSTSEVPPRSTSRQETKTPDRRSTSPAENIASEPKPASRKESTASQHPISDKRVSIAQESNLSSQRGSVADEQKAISPKEIISGEQLLSSKRASASIEQPQKVPSRRESFTDEQKPASRKESVASEQVTAQRRQSITDEQKPASRKSSTVSEQPITQMRASPVPAIVQPSSRRGSTDEEPKIASRKSSTNLEKQPASQRTSTAFLEPNSSRRESAVNEEKPSSHRRTPSNSLQVPGEKETVVTERPSSSRRVSATDEQKPSSRRISAADEQPTSSRHGSTSLEEKPFSQKESITFPPPVASKRSSFASQQRAASPPESAAEKEQMASRKSSNAAETEFTSRRESAYDAQKAGSRKPSTAIVEKVPSRRESPAPDKKIPSRQESPTSEEKVSSRRSSHVAQDKISSRRESSTVEEKAPSRRESHAAQEKVSSRRESSSPVEKVPSRRVSQNTQEEKMPSRRESHTTHEKVSSRRESHSVEEKVPSRRDSHTSDPYNAHRRQSSFDQKEQKSPSKPVSRKTSVVEQEQHVPSRRESQHKSSSNAHTSGVRDIPSSSPRRSSRVHANSSPESVRRQSFNKQEQPAVPTFANKDSHRSSLTAQDTNLQQKRHASHSTYKETPLSDADDYSHGTSTTHKQGRTPSTVDKEQKSSSTGNENIHRRSSFQRRSGQEPKRNSHLNADETVITPIVIDSSKNRRQNGKRGSTDSSYEQTPKSKLPPVNSSFQQDRHRRSETLNTQQIPVSNRSGRKVLSSSHPTTASEDEQGTHWSKKIPVPSIHLTDDDLASTPREDQPRPQSPNVEQLAMRNPVSTSSSTKKTSGIGKKRSDGEKTDLSKRKDQHRQSRRSTSVDSAANIRMVDDKSLDSTSDNTTDFEQHKRRPIKPRKKDVQTNTEQLFDAEQLQHNFFDDRELSSQKPLKATKPLSDRVHGTRRRGTNPDQVLTTPDTVRDVDTPIVRRTVKQSKDSYQDKDPVHVNVTVVVKKFAGTAKDETPTATAEAVVEQKPQQYFEHVQRRPEIPALTTENKDDTSERPKSTEEQPRAASPEQKQVEHHERHTQSDTEQIITETQKKRRRPKRISRTSQTYECVFRRMERDQQHDIRATSDTEKNIQTRKSQLRPRKKSPRKNLPVYLSTDSFRLEEVLPKQYHQSRRNMSKSSSAARSVSPQGGKLLILRPTLPFHHSDAVNVQRVCLQYAIDLIPNENPSSAATSTHRNRSSGPKQPEQVNQLPMIGVTTSHAHMPTNKIHAKEKSASHKSEDFTHPRKNGGAV